MLSFNKVNNLRNYNNDVSKNFVLKLSEKSIFKNINGYF